ncbi:site-specific integrase [Lutimaribacter saemankumensis]|uniref:Site-specific recombinase XerD n=1 Tax=Lutimaribacter saemankumensis TaxID=490829 RepID=A0A1G8T854_9RHOB|nr:site-specific integrase [Lutimaribacter saemankumensis]SDJ37577.1 Site-specific recombinase XerD [Lutimaribacter saemankumensis]
MTPHNSKDLTLADALQRLDKSKATCSRTRDRISAINRVATMLSRAPADLPCDPPELRAYLKTIHHVHHKITAKSLANIKAALADALRAAGCIPADDPKVDRSQSWEVFLGRVSVKEQAWSLSRLINYCCNRGIEPEDVDDNVVSEFRTYLDARLLTREPEDLCRTMAQTWNGIVSRHGLCLSTLSYQKGGYHRCLPLSEYPESLQSDIQAYVDRLAHKDIFLEDGPNKALRPLSLRNVKANVRQYLDALVSAGEDPAALVDLSSAITTEKVKTAFKAIMARRGTKKPPIGLHNIAATLTAIARYHLKWDESELTGLLNVKKRVAYDPKGMSEKNSNRLEQFNNWENIVRLISLPELLMTQARLNPESRLNALLAMHAAAIAILLSCPMRTKNLASLDLDRNVFAHRNGNHTIYSIRIDGGDVKNGEPIEFQMNSRNSRLLHNYITMYRPRISAARSSALFPKASNGAPRSPNNLAESIKTHIYDATGLTVNTHLFRHIAAYLYLREQPGDFETVRRLLKHRRLQTTMDFYAKISSEWAHEHYDKAVLTKWGDA